MILNSQGSTPGKTIMKQDLIMYSELTSHIKEPLIAPSPLIVMLSIGLLNRTLPLEKRLIAVIGQSWNFHIKVEPMDTIKVNYVISDVQKTKSGDKAVKTIEIQTINQKQQKVASGLWKILVADEGEEINE